MKKKSQLLLALLVLSGSFLISGKVSADILYDDCDYETTGSSAYGASSVCSSNITTNLTLYGIRWDVKSYVATGTVYMLIDDANGGASTCVATNNPTGTGYQTFELVTPYSFTAGQKPRIQSRSNSCVSNGAIINGDGGVSAYQVFYWSEDTLNETFSTSTRFITIDSPDDGEATSTNVTFAGSAVIFDDYADFDANAFIQILITQVNRSATTSANLRIPITADGTIQNFSTTTTLEDNSRYTWNAQIFCSRTYDWFSTCADSAAETILGAGFFQFTTGDFDPTFGISYDLSYCNVISGFDASECIYNLFRPNDTTFSQQFDMAKNTYARAWPIGYVSRVIEIISSSTPVKPPVITIDFPATNRDLVLDPWEMLMQEDSLLGQATAQITVAGETKGSGETLREATETQWLLVWSFILGIFIIRDILTHRIK